MSVDSSEDGMDRSIEQGLKSLQKMRNILEVSRYRQRRWYKLFTLKRVYRVVVTEKLSINDSGKYDDTQKKTENIDHIQGEKPDNREHREERDFSGYLLNLEV